MRWRTGRLLPKDGAILTEEGFPEYFLGEARQKRLVDSLSCRQLQNKCKTASKLTHNEHAFLLFAEKHFS